MTGLEPIADELRDAQRLLFVTGAGLSADSGLPTYRGLGGLYEVDTTEDEVPIEVALSGPMFLRRPALTWKYIRQIEAACRGARPNAGHEAIVKLESMGKQVTVLTQNVDGLHSIAGSSDVIEIHGNLYSLACTQCSWGETVADYSTLSESCPSCGRLVRPEVVLFEEMLPHAAVQRLEAVLRTRFDLTFAVGTSALFPYIAAPIAAAAEHGTTSVEINPTATMISDICTWTVRERAAVVLPALVDAL